MSVEKPILEYIKTIKIKTDLPRTVKAFKILFRYYKPFIILIGLLSILKAYLFLQEPIYTSKIIDQVAIAGQYDLLPGLILNINSFCSKLCSSQLRRITRERVFCAINDSRY